MTSAADSSNLMGGSFWNSIAARTVVLFLHQSCGRFLNLKARASCVGRRCLRPIRTSTRVSNRFENCTAGASPVTETTGAVALQPPFLQLPICAIPAQHLLNFSDVVSEKIVKKCA